MLEKLTETDGKITKKFPLLKKKVYGENNIIC